MARITTYALDSNISLNDKLVGTDADDNSITKNYSIDTLGDGLISLKNIITGGGTLNTIPLFTPDGQRIDDSIITQNALGTTIAVNGIFTVDNALTVTNGGDTNVVGDLEVDSGLTVDDSTTLNGALTVEGVSTFNDDIEVNTNATFYSSTTFEDTAVFQQDIGDSTSSSGTPGQILSSTGSATLWVDNNVLTSQATITDAQIRTLGTVPVEILPSVTGYIYEILGATIQPINSGSLGDAYDWGGQSGVISSRGNLFTNLHKVEIPNAQLPSGGGGISDSLYVGTPVAGLSRTGGSIKVTVTDNIDPTIPIAQDPSAQLLINITYKLTQVQ